MAGELDSQIAGKAVRALDNDRPDPITRNPLQHGQEAGALGHRIRAAHRRRGPQTHKARFAETPPRKSGKGLQVR